MKKSLLAVLALPLILSITILSTTIFSMTALASPTIQNNQPAGALSQKSLDRIYKEVRHELVMLPYYGVFDNLSYKVDPDGTVTLLGQVARPTLKSDAENVVKRIEGVEKVVNNIEVLPTSINDDRIRRAAYRAIYGNEVLSEYQLRAVPPIHIIVRNGNITLEGVVARQMEKQIAGMQANGVPGAFSGISLRCSLLRPPVLEPCASAIGNLTSAIYNLKLSMPQTSPQTGDPGEIDHAARLLRAGRLVAFPTETVYGLGANALDAEAVARIYAVKRRPAASPLIVHVASIEMAKSLVANWPEIADRLARRFWPGPR